MTTKPPPEVWDAMLEAGSDAYVEFSDWPAKAIAREVYNAMELAKVKAVLGGIRIDG